MLAGFDISPGCRIHHSTGGSRRGRALGFALDALVLPSPYAFAFGGFVELIFVIWWAAGGIVAGLFEALYSRLRSRRPTAVLRPRCATG